MPRTPDIHPVPSKRRSAQWVSVAALKKGDRVKLTGMRDMEGRVQSVRKARPAELRGTPWSEAMAVIIRFPHQTITHILPDDAMYRRGTEG